MIDKGRLIQILGGATLLGGIAGIPLIIAFSQTGWGSPGTSVYQTYELLNRLMAGALLLMSAGWLGVFLWLPQGYGRWAAMSAFIGSIFMVIGVSAEFWLFSHLPYAGFNMRHVAFSLFSLSGLLVDISVTILGTAIYRLRLWPDWSVLILLLVLPLDVVAFFGLNSIFLISTILALVVGANLLRTKPSPAEMDTAVP